jgi:catechol 2,3-dioxygenase-like lactoylglutathione lyase family enzyme
MSHQGAASVPERVCVLRARFVSGRLLRWQTRELRTTEASIAIVEGIGGVFVDSGDPAALAAWYHDHLGMDFEEHPDGGSFYIVYRTRDVVSDEIRENPVFAINPAKVELAGSDRRGFLVNLRVADLDAALGSLRDRGVSVEDDIVEWEGGRHGWFRDLDGNRVELYQELTLAPDSPFRRG